MTRPLVEQLKVISVVIQMEFKAAHQVIMVEWEQGEWLRVTESDWWGDETAYEAIGKKLFEVGSVFEVRNSAQLCQEAH